MEIHSKSTMRHGYKWTGSILPKYNSYGVFRVSYLFCTSVSDELWCYVERRQINISGYMYFDVPSDPLPFHTNVFKMPCIANGKMFGNWRLVIVSAMTQISRFMGPSWGPSGADRTQVDPMLAPGTLLSGELKMFFMKIGLFCFRVLRCTFTPQGTPYTWLTRYHRYVDISLRLVYLCKIPFHINVTIRLKLHCIMLWNKVTTSGTNG